MPKGHQFNDPQDEQPDDMLSWALNDQESKPSNVSPVSSKVMPTIADITINYAGMCIYVPIPTTGSERCQMCVSYRVNQMSELDEANQLSRCAAGLLRHYSEVIQSIANMRGCTPDQANAAVAKIAQVIFPQ